MSSDDGSMAAFQYWMYKAHTQPEAVALASRLNLDIPQGMTYGFKGGLGYAIFPFILQESQISRPSLQLFTP
jgi:hypothetical protein